MIKSFIFAIQFLFFTSCVSAQPNAGIQSNELSNRKSVSQVAEEWLKCPPPNPRRPNLCSQACCGDGSNWFVSCITFVGEVGKEANGHVDSELLKGYSTNPGVTYGSPMKAWAAMIATGRARYDFSKIEPGSAVFYRIPTFPAGHVAIYTGERDQEGEPLVITTGGYIRKDMRKEKISAEVLAVKAEILGWAKIQ